MPKLVSTLNPNFPTGEILEVSKVVCESRNCELPLPSVTHLIRSPRTPRYDWERISDLVAHLYRTGSQEVYILVDGTPVLCENP